MKIIKNPIEHISGLIACEIEIGGKWHSHGLEVGEEYEIHEDSDWSDIKPCDPATKTAHEQAEAARQVETDFTLAVQPLISGISQVERDTFERQEREALEWVADNEAPVKFIRALAEARDITIDGLVSKIIIKAELYSEALALALGTKHKTEDEL
tara:strand:- start:114 stop:578 length:465 start_codon:yes stop_codon:yes gene_type:complete